MVFHVPENYRIRSGNFATSAEDGNNGAFSCSDGMGWEHVSVSLRTRCPSWAEMHRVKNLFWDNNDIVVQYHPPESEYINNHPFCLHLWRQIGQDFNIPPRLLVGVDGVDLSDHVNPRK